MAKLYVDDWLAPGELTLPSGERLAYWTHHKTPRPTEVVLFLHGMKGNRKGLSALAWEYAHLHPDAMLVIPDLPGFGKSQPFTSVADPLTQYVQCVSFLLGAFPAKDVTIIGHSFGALLAYAYLATLHNYPVARAYFFAIQVTPKGMQGLLLRLFHQVGRRLPRRVQGLYFYNSPVNRWESMMFTKTRDRSIRKRIAQERIKELSDQHVPTLLAAISLVTATDLRELPPILHTKLTFIHGTKDNVSSPAAARQLAQRNQAPFIVVPNAGHYLVNELPEACGQVFKMT